MSGPPAPLSSWSGARGQSASSPLASTLRSQPRLTQQVTLSASAYILLTVTDNHITRMNTHIHARTRTHKHTHMCIFSFQPAKTFAHSSIIIITGLWSFFSFFKPKKCNFKDWHGQKIIILITKRFFAANGVASWMSQWSTHDNVSVDKKKLVDLISSCKWRLVISKLMHFKTINQRRKER